MTRGEIQYRLSEIEETSLQGLDDAAVLALLTERKELSAELAKLNKKETEEQTRQKEREAKREALNKRLNEINSDIRPNQEADRLLTLVQERKQVESELKALEAEDPTKGPELPQEKSEELTSEADSASPAVPETVEEGENESVAPEALKEEKILEEAEETKAPVALSEEERELPSEKIAIDSNVSYKKTSHISEGGKVSSVESAEDRVELDSSLQTAEYQGYLQELKENINSLGTFLQGLPITAKRHRAFMLEVAKIDPAYAMHYADKDTLKKDETFNLAIAGMNNQRNTGNPLSEMLPEMRTGSVVLEGVKNDFRNVRFARPEMPEYEAIIEMAKTGAREAFQALSGAHDPAAFIPPLLQKDKEFMAELQRKTV